MAHPYGGVHVIQGQLLEMNVVGCSNLTDKEWFTRQDPYVVVEYASNRFRTRTDTDGGKNPSFNEKFMLPLIEGLREVNISVWNSNSLSAHDLICSTRIFLEKALSSGYDDTSWPLKSRSGKYAGELRLILHYSHANKEKPGKNQAYPEKNYPPPSVTGHATAPPYPSNSYPMAPVEYATAPPYPSNSYPTAPVEYATAPPYPSKGYPTPPVGYPPQATYIPPSGHPAAQSSSEGSSYLGYPPAPYTPSGFPPSASQPPQKATPYAYLAAPSYPPVAPVYTPAAPGYPPPAPGYPPAAPGYPPAHIPPAAPGYPSLSQFAGPLAAGAAALGAYGLYSHGHDGKHGKHGKFKHGKFKGKKWGKHKWK